MSVHSVALAGFDVVCMVAAAVVSAPAVVVSLLACPGLVCVWCEADVAVDLPVLSAPLSPHSAPSLVLLLVRLLAPFPSRGYCLFLRRPQLFPFLFFSGFCFGLCCCLRLCWCLLVPCCLFHGL